MNISALEPNSIWKHFESLNAIPRASTKEEKVIEFIMSFGASLSLETTVDSVGNVIIKKPGTKGKENNNGIVLQGHLDMVHQKTMDSDFDFETQGIQMYVEDDWVKARETTLGADNGIGVSAIMAILSSSDIQHPPIEALFTIDEEMGMTGAMALTQDQLNGSLLLNLDSEEDDEITIGCAGGVDVEINGTYRLEALEERFECYELNISGLSGGHSGVDIHLNHANAIRVFANYISELSKKIEINVSSISSGTLTNVIPRDLKSTIAINATDAAEFESLHKDILFDIKKTYHATDENIEIIYKRVGEQSASATQGFQEQLITAIQNMPNGVFSMTEGMNDLVQTSNSIAKITLQDGIFNIACHTRSSVDTERDLVVNLIRSCFPMGETNEIVPYPGWRPNPNSNLLHIAKKCYEDLNGTEPAVKSIHAGLECGIVSEIYPNMEMISFGPNILGAHSPDERLQISSVQKFWKFLVELLKHL